VESCIALSLLLRKRAKTLANVRIRGKIPHEEWPKIAERFRRGETLTQIARSYHCTAPAIRYIVARVPLKGTKAKQRSIGAAAAAADRGDLSFGLRPPERRSRPAPLTHTSTGVVWNRMQSEIASFLGAVDALSMEETDENYETLLMATDRLLWGSARTRLEVEEILKKRKELAPAMRSSG
jgi:hypothetical protein